MYCCMLICFRIIHEWLLNTHTNLIHLKGLLIYIYLAVLLAYIVLVLSEPFLPTQPQTGELSVIF